jgi:outer membrane immunogenic protein
MFYNPPTSSNIPAVSWDGAYLGIVAGAGLSEGRFEDCHCGLFKGERIGAFAGYNWMYSPSHLLGVEADINYDWNGKPFLGAGKIGTDFSGSVRLRAGQTTGNALLFLAGGVAAANVYVEDPDDEAAATGWTVGAGIDWTLTDQTFVRAEYRFNDFPTVGLAGVDTNLNQHARSIGLAIKF